MSKMMSKLDLRMETIDGEHCFMVFEVDGSCRRVWFDGDYPPLSLLQEAVDGYIEPVDYYFLNPDTQQPYEGLEGVSFLVNEEGLIRNMPVNLMKRYGTQGAECPEGENPMFWGWQPLCGPIVAYIPEENGRGGLTYRQKFLLEDLFSKLETESETWRLRCLDSLGLKEDAQ